MQFMGTKISKEKSNHQLKYRIQSNQIGLDNWFESEVNYYAL